MNAPKVEFNINNLSYQVSSLKKGIHFVEGPCEMGPVADPSELITSWAQFQKVFGGYLSTSDFPLLCERALNRGATLRVNRVVHFNDLTDKTSFSSTISDVNSVISIDLNADLITGNSVNININGVDMVQVDFLTDHATTMTLIVAALEAMSNVMNVCLNTTNRTFAVAVSDQLSSHSVTAAVTGGASQAGIVVGEFLNMMTEEQESLALLTSKYTGEIYNSLYYTIGTPSNGQSATHFNLTIGITGRPALTETYTNLTRPTTALTQASFLNTVKKASKLVEVTYAAAISGAYTLFDSYTAYFAGGSDGASIVTADYIGDSAGKTGLYAFDLYDDGYDVCAPEISDTTLHTAGSAYAENRKDLFYLAHLDNTNNTATLYITDRNTTAVNSIYTKFFGGGLYITNPIDGSQKAISEMGDVLGVMSYSDKEAAEWFSPSGIRRGKINNALGVVNNFGTPGGYEDINSLCNMGINMVVFSDREIYLNSDFTATYETSKLTFGSIVKLLIFIQRSIRPTCKRYISEPNDIISWKQLYQEVLPFFKSLVTGRALYDFRWDGDQYVNKITDVVVNTTADLDLGKYKVKLYLKTISPIVELTVELTITPSDFSYEVIESN